MLSNRSAQARAKAGSLISSSNSSTGWREFSTIAFRNAASAAASWKGWPSALITLIALRGISIAAARDCSVGLARFDLCGKTSVLAV